MKKLLIHVGTGKTGTTSIQTALHRARSKVEMLSSFGFVYPDISNHVSHEALSVIYRPIGRQPRPISRRYRGKYQIFLQHQKRYYENFIRALKKYDTIVLSSEYIISFVANDLQTLKQDIDRHGFEDVAAVIYVREPSSYYLSHVQQVIKASSKIPNPYTFRYPFLKEILKLSSIFPKVYVRAFDKDKLHNSCVVQDFLDQASNFFGKSVDYEIPKNLNQNVSLSADAMNVVLNYRKIFYPDHDNLFMNDSSLLVEIFSNLDSNKKNKARLKPEIRDYIRLNHLEDLIYCKNNYGLDFGIKLSKDGYPKGVRHKKFSGDLNDIVELSEKSDLEYRCLNKILNELLSQGSSNHSSLE